MSTTPATPEIVSGPGELRAILRRWRAGGDKIGLVPTMGALHEGHLALARQAAEAVDKVVVSIFVNPAQFAPHEDFERYPRDLEGDARLLAAAQTDLIFAPDRSVMYPSGAATTVAVTGPGEDLETNFRPHFFTGVATVVTKLLNLVAPDVAVFGEKDYQQLLVIRRLVTDLHLPVEVLGGEIVRETDGLALSSRNAYLSPQERRAAPALSATIHAIARNIGLGANIAAEIENGHACLREAGFWPVDYLEVRDAETLAKIDRLERPARVLAAAKIGETRLIDNCAVPAD